MKNHNCFRYMAVALIVFITVSCGTAVKEARFGADEAPHRFIFACDSSPFKDQVREQLIAEYQATSQIEVVNIDRLESLAPEKYDLVLAIDTCYASTGFNPSLTRFLEKNSKSRNIVVFMTSANPGWKFPDDSIDAITSASNIENVDQVVDQIARKINAIVPQAR